MLELIFPPPWDTFTVYPSLPVLLKDLKTHNIPASGVDLNYQLIDKLLTVERLIDAYERLGNVDFTRLSDTESRLYSSIVQHTPFLIENIENAKQRLKAKQYDLGNPPRQDWETIILGTQLLSLPFFPCEWYRNTYWIHGLPKKRPQNFQDVFNHINNVEKPDFFAWAYTRDEITPLILDKNIRMVGISVCSLIQVIPAFVLAKTIKRYNPDIHIVLGGAFIRYIMDTIRRTPRVFEYIDSVVEGRGEGTLAHLYELFSSGTDEWKNAPGTTYLDQSKVTSNEVKPSSVYASYSPPEYSAFPLQDYFCDECELNYISSSGCYWGKCAFCSETNINDDYRYISKPADIVVKELDSIIETTGVKVIEMTDNTMPLSKAIKIAEYFISKNSPILWTMLARAEEDFNEENLRYLYKGGLRFISWGIETFSQKYLSMINKGINMETVHRLLKTAHDIGIWNHLFMIIGFPGETEQEMTETIKQLEKVKDYLDSMSLSNFHLHRNSLMYQNPAQYNIKIKENPDLVLDTSYYYETPDIDLKVPLDNLYALFELYLSNFHFHTSNFRGFSTARICTLIDKYGKKRIREYFTEEADNKTLQIADKIL